MEKEQKKEKIFINVGIVLNKNGEVLIVKRKKPEITESGKILLWTFPSGKQEKGQSREECIEKEVLEETGYKVKAIRQLNLRVHPDITLMVAYHLCELIDENPGDIIEKDEIEEVKWVKPEELKNYFTTDIDPEVRKFLNI